VLRAQYDIDEYGRCCYAIYFELIYDFSKSIEMILEGGIELD